MALLDLQDGEGVREEDSQDLQPVALLDLQDGEGVREEDSQDLG